MGLRINQNVAALTAHKNLGISDARLSKSLERLSSGLRINRAADDAAGLTISEKLRGQVRGLQQAVRNSQDGISMVQTAEGGLQEIENLLQRMRELAVQSSNDTLTDNDRTAIQGEVSALRSEIDRIAGATEFNTKKLLNGGLTQAIANPGVSLTPANGIADVELAGAAIGVAYEIQYTDLTNTLTLVGPGGASSQSVVIAPPAGMDTTVVSFSSLGVNVTINSSLDAAGDRSGAGYRFDVTGTGSGYIHVGANSGSVAQFQEISISITSVTAADLGIAAVSVGTQAAANTAIGTIDTAIGTVSSNRSSLGALQNRLDYAIASLNVSVENLTASEGRIRDLDVASEMVEFTRNQIMLQAGTAMLAQANAAPQSVLSLLRG